MNAPLKVPGTTVSDKILPAGAYWHKRLSKGSILRIVDLEGCQAVDTIVYDAARHGGALQRRKHHEARTQRLSVEGLRAVRRPGAAADDDRCEDTVGRHDTLGGQLQPGDQRRALRRSRRPRRLPGRFRGQAPLRSWGWGRETSRQTSTSSCTCRSSGDGHVAIADGISKPGDYVDLRCEKDVHGGDLQLSAGAQPLLRRDTRRLFG